MVSTNMSLQDGESAQLQSGYHKSQVEWFATGPVPITPPRPEGSFHPTSPPVRFCLKLKHVGHWTADQAEERLPFRPLLICMSM